MKAKAVPAADIITPNQFELEYLSGRECKTLAQARDAVKAAHALGPRVILVTSLQVEDTPKDAVDLLASDAAACFRLRTPRLPLTVNGAGDAIAALFFAHYLRSGRVDEALSNAASALFGVLAKTADAGAPELALIAAQDELVNPSRVFEARSIAMTEEPALFQRRAAGAVLHAKAMGLRGRAARRDRCLFRRAAARKAGHLERPRAVAASSGGARTACSAATISKPTMRALPPGAIGAGRPPACMTASARRPSWPPMARSCSASWPRTPSMPAGFIFPAARPIPKTSWTARSISNSACGASLRRRPGSMRPTFAPEPGWFTVVDGPRIAQVKLLRSRQPAEELARAHAGASRAREAAGIVGHSSSCAARADFALAMPRFVTAFLAQRLAVR